MPKKICSYEYFQDFKKLWKTHKALKLWCEETTEDRKQTMFNVLVYYYPKTCIKKEKVNRKDIADKVFSEYIRLINADDKGYCTCVTCLSVKFWTEMDCGHYRTRGHTYSRFMEDNNHPQCDICNRIKNGNYRNYLLFMRSKYGEEREDFLWNNNEIKKIYDYEYIDMIYGWYDVIVQIKKNLT